ncbi:hypothetical protein [Burkholderia vietnamiensis]|uniref:hypothetical protein n=1 Tax=Burkholderia vietnamiensis TaxID=60552 RepID=UPI000A6A18A6|nr:hypothetical protein [Burkholderia vietnamiensis]HDR8929613.1 hypothetical protein [Burkholderia vietnamiensis]HDR9128868.1 hypothetical protein [Burkholderia vietnamiensis]HDR9217182.1 hypothetical protein [Burkholderia vietnamiensis]
MPTHNDTIAVANTLIQKLNEAAMDHHHAAAEAIQQGRFDAAIGDLTLQREATGALIAALEAVKFLKGE